MRSRCTGPDRRKYKLKHLKRYDFVLTTYATLIADYDDDEMMEKKAKKMAKKNNEADAWEEYVETKEPGPLFQMSFYRVILDEARTQPSGTTVQISASNN